MRVCALENRLALACVRRVHEIQNKLVNLPRQVVFQLPRRDVSESYQIYSLDRISSAWSLGMLLDKHAANNRDSSGV